MKPCILNYEALAKLQQKDQELKTYLHQEKGLQLTVKIPGSEFSIWCDTTIGSSRLFLTKPFRRAAFEIIHNLAPGIKTTTKLVAQRYV